jgi:DNA-binding NtrC family response regulator
MSAERAEAIEALNQGRLQEPSNCGPSLPFRIAKHPERDRVQRLIDLAHTLLREAEMLVGEKTFVDESNRLKTLNISEGVDYFSELKRFEVSLIKLALAQTSGHQAQAAKLLNLKPTTLNTKIKLYGIKY